MYLSIRSSPHERTWSHCGGERRSPPATRRLPAKTAATGVDRLRSPLLGRAVAVLERLARCVALRTPDTVVRWQRERFRKFWARLSRVNRRRRGRPVAAVEIRRLIERILAANPLWRAPRIHGELKMLGIAIPNALSREFCEGFAGLPLRRGRRFFTTTSANWCRLISSLCRRSP